MNFTASGVYLDAGTRHKKDNVLLPGKEIPSGVQEGDMIEVFIYKDSENRLTATTQKPLAELGDLARLRVTAKTKFGAFLDFGIERGLFLPFREQKFPVQVGKSYLVHLYLDKSERLCCTTDVYKHLHSGSPYQKNDKVQGTVYDIKPEFGVFVAVDNQYFGLIPPSESFGHISPGDQIEARVLRVREDGKLDLSPREVAYKQMESDAEMLLGAMKANHGFLSADDKTPPEKIKQNFGMSKAAFKRAVGGLLKARKIIKTPAGYRLAD